MKELPDDELFKLIQADSERAFSILFDRYKTSLYRHLFQRIRSEMETEDILQNIFISLWRNRQTIVINDSVLPYLLGAAKKSVFAHYASTAKAIENSHLLQSADELFEYPEEEFLIAREVEELLQQEVEKMPAMMKQAFQLSRKEHLTVREIAARLSISEQTVKNNITMALQRLRRKLNPHQIVHVVPFILFLN
jgi:RNA polymerase sigma-70 factor (ECF subfamily)